MNGSQIARICATVKPLALLLLVACGSPAGTDTQFQDTDPVAGAAGSGGAAGSAQATAGGSVSSAGADGVAVAGMPTAGAGGAATTAGMPGSAGAAAGQPGASGGGAGSSSHGGSGGTGGGGSAGHAGAAQAGSGGAASDPLDPKPAVGCPGYIDILVPLNTCLWFHGDPPRTVQNAACDIIDPPSSTKCSTVTATLKDITSRVSAGATFERFSVDPQTGLCPKQCS